MHEQERAHQLTHKTPNKEAKKLFESNMATARQDLIQAAKKLDIDLVRDILTDASFQITKQDALGLECRPPEWGSCHNKSALHAAVKALPYKEQEEKLQKWKDLLHLLLQHGVDPHVYFDNRNWKGSGVKTTALQMVVGFAASDVELLQMFLDAGADPNLPGHQFIASMRADGQVSYTTLHTALLAGAPMEGIVALVHAGADVSAGRSYCIDHDDGYNEDREESPLHIATKKWHIKIVSLLLFKGAVVDAEQRYLQQDDVQEDTDSDGYGRRYTRMKCLKQRTLHAAARANKPKLVKLLVLHGAGKSSLCIDGEKESNVMQLIEETTITDANGKSALFKTLQTSGWSPVPHKYYPKAFKKTFSTTLLTANKLDWPMDQDLLSRFESFPLRPK